MIIPIWISFPNRKTHLYEKLTLLLIAKTIGKPLFIDEATANGSRLSVARVCMEYDCKKDPINQVWIMVKDRVTETITGGTHLAKLEVHLLVRHRRNSDSAVSLRRTISSASEDAMGMRENDGVPDNDAISVLLWDCLRSLPVNIHTPWIVEGDFNAILHHEERLYGWFNERLCYKIIRLWLDGWWL
ncbi:Uncharacterized protein TCM_032793 [Theobroma cacao]|uniref:Uncharacterized protein n=1 Tax=Theobroma cacao TaxID=3641 RepID=A0A061FAK1_THECC|nr:Uncharacterized protein TCM_032793 [Theobroma cacao]